MSLPRPHRPAWLSAIAETAAMPLPLAALPATVALGGCSYTSEPDAATPPAFLVGTVAQTRRDGLSDDLLTAGLGRAGLQSSFAPAVSTPPASAPLRRLAIRNNDRALLDPTDDTVPLIDGTRASAPAAGDAIAYTGATINVPD